MAKYCKFCGLPVKEGKNCTCEMSQNSKKKTNDRVSDVKGKVEENMGIPNEKGRLESYERGKRIVPDCILPNEGEIPIRQYDIAKLRTVFKGAFAEGRLQVTNKRVLFRSSGYSLLGPNKAQYEFALDEIAGIEIRNDHRLGVFHLVVGITAFAVITSMMNEVFSKFSGFSPFFASVVTLALFIWATLFFFAAKDKWYIKLIFNAMAAGALSVQALTTKFLVIPVLDGSIFSYMEGICLILVLLNYILIAYVPNLVLIIKTKGASNPIEIRRKEGNGLLAFLFHMPKKDYTGYSDVMPGRDLEKARKELGAMINDLNKNGDLAIDKWKEN